MARSVSLTTLITRVRQRVDIEAASAMARFPDAELTDNLNESLAELYDLIREAWGQEYFRATSPVINTVAGTSLYSLPADFLSLISVDVMINGQLAVNARRFNEKQANALRAIPFGPVQWNMYTPIYYRPRASNIEFLPTPNGVYQIFLNYIPTPTRLVSGGDTFDGIGGWEEYAVLDAAIKAMKKDNDYETVGSLEQSKAAMADRIRRMAPQRDAGEPEVARDIYEEMNAYDLYY